MLNMHTPEYYGFLVGINYIDTENELQGCVDDIEDMAKIMQESGVPARNIQMLSDAYEGADKQPTRENILAALKAVVAKAKPNDIIFFHYSGHGANSLRIKNDYEAICPLNNGKIELIADFELHEIITKLPPGAKFVSALDCCHSGDMFNLEYNLNETKLTHAERQLKLQQESATQAKEKAKDKKKDKEKEKSAEKFIHLVPSLPVTASKPKPPHGYVVVLSGCEIKQTSADAEQDGRPQGAFTACLKDLIKKHGFHDILDICLSGSKDRMRVLDAEMLAWMKKNHYTQRPDFSFEGQLAPLQKALMQQAKASTPSKAAEHISEEEAKAVLFGFARFVREAGSKPFLQTQVASTSLEAKNDEKLQFPTRRKLSHH